MNKLPTAAEVRRVVIDLNGFGEYLTANGRKGDGLIAEAVWLLESFVELLTEREKIARTFREMREYYEKKMGNELPPVPPEAE